MNLSCIAGSILVVALWHIVRADAPALVSTLSLLRVGALAAIIFCLPDLLCRPQASGVTWHRCWEFNTLILLATLGVGGVLLAHLPINLGWLVLPVGTVLAARELHAFTRSKSKLEFPIGVVVIGAAVLLLYSRGYLHPWFSEKIVLGVAKTDTLFHASISSMVSTVGWSTIGVDWVPYYSYHWGSHGLFAGLSAWVDVDAVTFYNVAYPAIFVPLFFKSASGLVRRISSRLGHPAMGNLFALAALALLLSTAWSGFDRAHPFLSESSCVAYIVAFLYAGTLLTFVEQSKQASAPFLWFSVLVLLCIAWIKVSAGWVACSVLVYLALRTSFNRRSLAQLTLAALLVGTCVVGFVVPFGRLTEAVGLSARWSNLWLYSDGFVTYLLGALVAIAVLLARGSLSRLDRFRAIFSSRENLDLELLFVATMAGIGGAVAVSARSTDVYYFCMPQFYFAVLYLVALAQRGFDGLPVSNRGRAAILVLVVLASVSTQPGGIRALREVRAIKGEMSRLTQQQTLLADLVQDLHRLRRESAREDKCVFIGRSERWYHESQSVEWASELVVPAISGVALIGGEVPALARPTTSFLYGDAESSSSQVLDLETAKAEAARRGYRELIDYREVAGGLQEQRFTLQALGG